MKSNFTFAYSRSTSVYDRNKDAKKTSKLSFKEKHGSIDELVNDVKKGYAFCGTFNHDGATFGLSTKSQANFKSTNLIVFDMDAVKYTAGEFYGKTIATDYTPSIIYTTANDGHFKDGKDETYCNRYRVIYVTDEPIKSVEQYTQIHQALKSDLASYVGDDNIFNDNTDKDASHFFAGCSDTELYCTNRVISTLWLFERYNAPLTVTNNVDVYNDTSSGNKQSFSFNFEKDKGIRTQYNDNHLTMIEASAPQPIESAKTFPTVDIKKKEKYYSTVGNKIALFDDFKNDYLHTKKSIYVLSSEYQSILPLLPEETTVTFDGEKLYKEVDETHIKIRHTRHKVSKKDAKGNDVEVWEPVKFRNGQKRREKLYLYLQMIKAITPSATFEQLLWQAVNFMIYHVDNSDKSDMITKRDILTRVKNAMNHEWKPSEKSKQKYKVTIAVDKKLAAEKGIKRRFAGLVANNECKTDKKLKKWAMIEQYFDPLKSDKENVKIMQDEGIEVTMQYIRKWKSLNGYSKHGKQSKSEQIAIFYDDGLTDNQNIEQLAANGIKVSLRTLKNWKKENGYTKQRNKLTSEPHRATQGAFNHVDEQSNIIEDELQQGANEDFWCDIDVVALADNFLKGKPHSNDDGTRYNDDEETIFYDDGTEVILPW